MSKKGPTLFDVRAIQRNLRHGVITRDDVQNYIDSLPDVSHKAVTLGEIEDDRAAELADIHASAVEEEVAPPVPIPTTPTPPPPSPSAYTSPISAPVPPAASSPAVVPTAPAPVEPASSGTPEPAIPPTSSTPDPVS